MTRDVGWTHAAQRYLDVYRSLRRRYMTETARRIVLARRPQGMPAPDDFRLEDTAVPEPADGEVLVRTIWLSLDPYMRGRIERRPVLRQGYRARRADAGRGRGPGAGQSQRRLRRG